MPGRTPVTVSGLPGRMAAAAAAAATACPDLELVPFALTGPGCGGRCRVAGVEVECLEPSGRDDFREKAAARPGLLVVDYTHPSAALSNAEFYLGLRLPFVIGTTGYDRERLEAMVRDAGVHAVVAPNMALPIVALMSMLEWAAREFPGVLKGFDLRVRESHQQGKADTSGTAKALIASFKALGATFDEKDLLMCRDPEEQRTAWGVPPEHLAGHAFHAYDLATAGGATRLRFGHDVLGREVYARGTAAALRFLARRRTGPHPGRSWTMNDVLRHLED